MAQFPNRRRTYSQACKNSKTAELRIRETAVHLNVININYEISKRRLGAKSILDSSSYQPAIAPKRHEHTGTRYNEFKLCLRSRSREDQKKFSDFRFKQASYSIKQANDSQSPREQEPRKPMIRIRKGKTGKQQKPKSQREEHITPHNTSISIKEAPRSARKSISQTSKKSRAIPLTIFTGHQTNKTKLIDEEIMLEGWRSNTNELQKKVDIIDYLRKNQRA